MPTMDRPPTAAAPRHAAASHDIGELRDICDICGREELYELKCKVVCGNCRSIVRSCADLG